MSSESGQYTSSKIAELRLNQNRRDQERRGRHEQRRAERSDQSRERQQRLAERAARRAQYPNPLHFFLAGQDVPAPRGSAHSAHTAPEENYKHPIFEHASAAELRHLCDTIRRDRDTYELVTDFLATSRERMDELDDPQAREVASGFLDGNAVRFLQHMARLTTLRSR